MRTDPIEQLSEFTPSAEGLDREALLFEAGRASARPRSLGWAVAGVLALTQLVTLVVMRSPSPPPTPAPAVAPEPSRVPVTAQRLPPEPPTENLVPDGPPLRPMDHDLFTSLE